MDSRHNVMTEINILLNRIEIVIMIKNKKGCKHEKLKVNNVNRDSEDLVG